MSYLYINEYQTIKYMMTQLINDFRHLSVFGTVIRRHANYCNVHNYI